MKADWWDARYDKDAWSYGDAPNDFLREVRDQLPGGRALCLAAGEGRNAVFLAQDREVTAVDQSAVGLAKAAALAKEHDASLTTEVADLATFDFGDGWAVITSIWAHVPAPIRVRVHQEVVRSLQPGGALVLEAYTPAQVGRGTGGPPDPTLTPTLAALQEELRGLDFVIGREVERDVREGLYHTGMSSVVQVLAFKR